MDSGTGMISNNIIPKFSQSTVNVVAQCLFIKGKHCFKSIISKLGILNSNQGQTFSICGNRIVEYGEDCDSADKCCNQPGTLNECKFTKNAVCTYYLIVKVIFKDQMKLVVIIYVNFIILLIYVILEMNVV